MSNEKEKTTVGRFLQNVGGPLIRSAIKQVPFLGTPIVEIASNLLGAKKLDKVTWAEVPKHSYVSIVMQFAIAISVLYAFFTKAITIQEVVEMLKGFIPA